MGDEDLSGVKRRRGVRFIHRKGYAMVYDDGFDSEFRECGPAVLPPFSGIRVMMMPLVLGDLSTMPGFLAGYKTTMERLFEYGGHAGEVGYLTIDERAVRVGETHRRSGLHVDGVYQGRAGGWGGGGGGGWGAHGNGMLTVSSPSGCRAWDGRLYGWPGMDGECDHLRSQLGASTTFRDSIVYWVDGLCVHESVPMRADTNRTFVRLSMPSEAPWFEGYTENPLGVKPTGPILPRRKFMDS